MSSNLTSSAIPPPMPVEREIAEALQTTGIRLRQDKVVHRVIAALRASLAPQLPPKHTVLFTLSAPIHQPAQTANAIVALYRPGLPPSDICAEIHGNHVRLRCLPGVPSATPAVLVFVHNPGVDATAILDLAQSRLRKSNTPSEG